EGRFVSVRDEPPVAVVGVYHGPALALLRRPEPHDAIRAHSRQIPRAMQKLESVPPGRAGDDVPNRVDEIDPERGPHPRLDQSRVEIRDSELGLHDAHAQAMISYVTR